MYERVECMECGCRVPDGTVGPCPACRGILMPRYAPEAISRLAEIQPGPDLNRYREVLPLSDPFCSLGEGDTPLVPSRRLGASIGLSHLFFKNEGRNPTGAFKDRGAAVVAGLAGEAGAGGLVTASSGNAASAVSAYCAAAGLHCVILFEPGNPTAKLRQALATGATVVPVDEVFSRGPEGIAELVFSVAEELEYYPAFIWAPVNPYILEGMKTISYEIAARLPGPPDALVCPVGGGDMFAAQWRGYNELLQAGVIDRLPRMIGVQSESAPPLLTAWREHRNRVPTLPYARSRISGINVPFTGDHALRAIVQSGGVAAGVEDDQVVAMQARMGIEEGVWVEPAGAASVAALRGLLERGEVAPDENVVCILSGAGFKDSSLAQAEVEVLAEKPPVPFAVDPIVQVARQAAEERAARA